jgi:hypothetical protein
MIAKLSAAGAAGLLVGLISFDASAVPNAPFRLG